MTIYPERTDLEATIVESIERNAFARRQGHRAARGGGAAVADAGGGPIEASTAVE